VVVESTAMAWFVAAVAVLRSGIDARMFRVSGTKAAALRKFYRAHTKTDRIDVRVLARMPMVDDGLHELVLPDASELALKRLVVLRNKLVGEVVKVDDRVRSTLHWAAPGLLSGRESVTDGFLAVLARWPDVRRLAAARPATIAKTGHLPRQRAEKIRDAAADAVAFYGGGLAGESSAGAAQTATLATRQAKGERRSEAELREDWARRARQAGIRPGWHEQLLERNSWERPELALLRQRLVVEEELTETSSTFTRTPRPV
jgi:hypothetical protein